MDERKERLMWWIWMFAALMLMFGMSGLYLNRPTTEKKVEAADVAPAPYVELNTLPMFTEIVEPADDLSLKVAGRIDPPEPIPPDPCGQEMRDYVNNIQYETGNPLPPIEAYRIVAKCNGWTDATIAIYEEGVIFDILPKESMSCPLLMGTQRLHPDCTAYGSGNGEDAGWCQITSAGWGPGGILRTMGFYSHWSQIIADPWSSMDACVKLIMYTPSRPGFPWSWDKGEPDEWACSYHPIPCWEWPKEWVNV
jgi:hypothetical protein